MQPLRSCDLKYTLRIFLSVFILDYNFFTCQMFK